jgi:hypothetical protein
VKQGVPSLSYKRVLLGSSSLRDTVKSVSLSSSVA